MSGSLSHLGPADLRIAGFHLWVQGYEFPSADDGWDGNWLRITAHSGEAGAEVTVAGAILDTVSFLEFEKELRALSSALTGNAVLDSHEPHLRVTLTGIDRLGHIRARVEITPDHMSQQHTFDFAIDQSFLPPLISQCAAILERCPVRQPVERGA